MKRKITLYCVVAIVTLSTSACLKNFWKINVQNCKKCPQPKIPKDFADYYLFEEGSMWEYNVYDSVGVFLYTRKCNVNSMDIDIDVNPNHEHWNTNDTLYTKLQFYISGDSMHKDEKGLFYYPSSLWVLNAPQYTESSTVFTTFITSTYNGIFIDFSDGLDSLELNGGLYYKVFEILGDYEMDGNVFHDVKKVYTITTNIIEYFKTLYYAKKIGLIQVEHTNGMTLILKDYDVTLLSETRPELFE